MNSQRSLQNQGKATQLSYQPGGSTTITPIDRKRIFIFVAIAWGLSIAMGVVIFRGGGLISNSPKVAARSLFLLNILMFAPMIANIAARLITREGLSSTFLRADFRRGRWRYYLAAWFLPIVATSVGAAIYYLFFPGHFDPSMTAAREQGLAGSTREPWVFFITQLGMAILSPIPPLTFSLFLSFGEEFGWRAYLLPKLMPLGPRRAVLLVGAIWGIWHWPAIFMGFNYGLDYWGAPVVGPLLFVVVMIFSSAFYAWVTLRSGSVWPAALAHGAVNASNQPGWIFFSGEPNQLIGPGIQGIIGSLGYAILAVLIFISARALAKPASAPSNPAFPENPGAVGKTADQPTPGIYS
jgi:membrane protease YdiL (CAAX protease family)